MSPPRGPERIVNTNLHLCIFRDVYIHNSPEHTLHILRPFLETQPCTLLRYLKNAWCELQVLSCTDLCYVAFKSRCMTHYCRTYDKKKEQTAIRASCYGRQPVMFLRYMGACWWKHELKKAGRVTTRQRDIDGLIQHGSLCIQHSGGCGGESCLLSAEISNKQCITASF